MSALEKHIESFLNGNVTEAKAALAKRLHRHLRHGYQDATGCSDAKATAFADYIKGGIGWQTYCDTL